VRALPQVGEHVAGYRIERQLGRGGMGVVYLAEQTRLRRYVALKLIVPEFAEDEEFRRRFERESQLAASLDHPNVIPVYEAGEADGALFISMRYVEGSDLRALIRAEGRIERGRAAQLIAQLGAALDAAHARGLVHRDVKPANVLVSGPPAAEQAYLTDFGLTKHVSSESGLTHTGQWVGTLDYVAPEQISGGPLDARVDIYSLGCVMFQALTGQVPYPKDSDVAKMYAHLHEPPARVSQLVPGMPIAFDGVIDRALAKLPGNRYPSAGDLGRAALAAAQGQHSTAPERSVAAGGAALITQPRGGPTVAAAPAPADQTGPTARLPAQPPPPAPPPQQQWVTAPPPPQQQWSAAPPQQPRSGSPWLIVAAVAAVLAVAGAAAALVATGAFKSSKNSAATVTVESPAAAPSAEPAATVTTPAPPAESTPPAETGTATYTAGTYAADYPAGWAIVEDDVDKGAYTETKFQSPDGSAAVLIDRTPGSPLDPPLEAQGVEVDTARTPGYRRLVFHRTTLGGKPGFVWIFQLPSGPRVDYFTNVGGGRFAVLGTGSDFATARVAARSVAASLR
jgi:serine/threonine protein kinase